MNFVEAVKLMKSGKTLTHDTLNMNIYYEDGAFFDKSNDEIVDFTDLDYENTTWKVVEGVPVIDADELYAVFDPSANRWISTTNPAKHKAAGKQVAVFSLAQTI